MLPPLDALSLQPPVQKLIPGAPEQGHNKRKEEQELLAAEMEEELHPDEATQLQILGEGQVEPAFKAMQVNYAHPMVVDFKTQYLLAKLTIDNFHAISDRLIELVNLSVKEKDGRTLITVIRRVYEKATAAQDVPSAIYARLCKKAMQQISPDIQDDGVKDAEGKPMKGDLLFRKYLLNRCQEDFEKGWQGVERPQVAKRQTNLMKFMAELFKVRMLTERILHECVKKLLGDISETERLCALLVAAGQLLDTPRARAHVDVYFQRIKNWSEAPDILPRFRAMLQEVMELREHKWVRCNQVTDPATTIPLHEAPSIHPSAYRRINTFLDELTLSNLDLISNAIIQLIDTSDGISGRILFSAVRLAFDKGVDEAGARSELCASLLSKMMKGLSSQVEDDHVKNIKGEPVTGGRLLHKFLIDRYREDLVCYRALKQLEGSANPYQAGLVKFVGELFKFRMLTKGDIHAFVKRLLYRVDVAEEEDIECLCQLLSNVGQLFDTPQSRASVDVYFAKMKVLSTNPDVTIQTQKLLQDVIELRERHWVTLGD